MCHIVAQREHFSLRLDAETRRELERLAAERNETKTHLAERYVAEGVRVARHPSIVFRDGPAGRRPGLAGGPDVWEVVATFLAEGRDVGAASSTLGMQRALVDAALAYYADYPDEIDAWIETNRALAEELEAAWRRRRALASA